MSVFRGNTSGSIASVPMDIPCKITGIVLMNNSGSTATVNVYISNNSSGQSILIFPKNMAIPTGEGRERFDPLKIIKGDAILITTNQSLDYYITFSPINENE